MNRELNHPREIVVRPASLRDADAIAVLCGQLGYATQPAEVCRRLARGPGEFDGLVAVAVEGDRVVGWVEVCVARALVIGSWAEITGLVVDQDARRCGVGTRLVQWAKTWAREHDQKRLRVRSNVVRPESPAFYEHHGFVQAKQQRVFELAI